jgi:lactate permease
MDFWIAVIPILFLIVVMTKTKSWPSHLALPATALLVYLLRFLYFEAAAAETHAALIKGVLSALTPLAIIWSAILLSDFMNRTGAQEVVNRYLNELSRNRVAQLMLIGWAFAFMLEGASGFGTPAAIAAPILVALGFPALRVAILTLVMNSVPVSFGAVGTPTWFGFAPLGLTEAELLSISPKIAMVHTAASLVIPALALCFVLKWHEIRRNLIFVLLSSLSCSLPFLGLSFLNYEFPSLLGGGVGLAITALLARSGFGLSEQMPESDMPASPDPAPLEGPLSTRPRWIAFTPYLLLMGILILTRIPDLGIRALLSATSPYFSTGLGALGEFRLSAALVVELKSILGTAVNWSFPMLFVPALIPFVIVVLLSKPILHADWNLLTGAAVSATRRIRLPAVTLVGALIMVELMMESSGPRDAMTVQIGQTVAAAAGTSWPYFASLMGALGAFFSGSASVSNLTFGAIQQSIALATGLDPQKILALQSVGGAMGNMVCINNIIAVSTILGITHAEGKILKRTVLPLLVYALIAAGMSLLI